MKAGQKAEPSVSSAKHVFLKVIAGKEFQKLNPRTLSPKRNFVLSDSFKGRSIAWARRCVKPVESALVTLAGLILDVCRVFHTLVAVVSISS